MAKVVEHSRRYDASWLEILLLLSIIIIILGMTTRYLFKAHQNDKINITVSQIGSLITTVRNYKTKSFINRTHPINMEVLSAAGQLNDLTGYNPADHTLKTVWGQKISITSKQGVVTIKATLPNNAVCLAIKKAYSPSTKNNINSIQSSCDNTELRYVFS